MTRRLVVLLTASLALSACSSTSAATNDESNDAVEEAQPAVDRGASAEAAQEVADSFAQGTASYFRTEQKTTAGEPWHPIVNGDGFPVMWDVYTFPGGPNLTFTTHDTIPSGGEELPATLDASDPMVAAALAILEVDLSGDHPFRYTYSTGPGTGGDATAIVTAEADFDPASPEVHTIVIELEIDNETQEVIVRPPVTMNEFM